MWRWSKRKGGLSVKIWWPWLSGSVARNGRGTAVSIVKSCMEILVQF